MRLSPLTLLCHRAELSLHRASVESVFQRSSCNCRHMKARYRCPSSLESQCAGRKVPALGARARVLCCASLCAVLTTIPAVVFACSTFVLHDSKQTIYAHHLDERGYVPGSVVVNRRGTWRQGASWNGLIKGEGASQVSWTSKWGSITFNIWGIGYPDGGVNERGLYVQEMSLAGSRPPIDRNLPPLFAPA